MFGPDTIVIPWRTRLGERARRARQRERDVASGRSDGHPYSLAVVDSISDYLGTDEKLSADIRKTVTTRLALWNNPLIAAATEASDFDLSRA